MTGRHIDKDDFPKASRSAIICENGHTSIYTVVILSKDTCFINHKLMVIFIEKWIESPLNTRRFPKYR